MTAQPLVYTISYLRKTKQAVLFFCNQHLFFIQHRCVTHFNGNNDSSLIMFCNLNCRPNGALFKHYYSFSTNLLLLRSKKHTPIFAFIFSMVPPSGGGGGYLSISGITKSNVPIIATRSPILLPLAM